MLNRDKGDKKTVFLGIRIPEKLRDYLQERSSQMNISLSQYVRNILIDQFFFNTITRTEEGITNLIRDKVDKQENLKRHFANFEEAINREDVTHPDFALALEGTAEKLGELVRIQKKSLSEMEERLGKLKRIEEEYKRDKKRFHEKWTNQIKKEFEKSKEEKK